MNDKLHKTLKDAGYSLTQPRQAIFDLLSSDTALSMRELTQRLAPSIDRASIYRTVALFEKLSITVRVNSGWKYKVELSDKFTPHHHHMTCVKCAKVISFDEPEGFDELLAQTTLNNGFKIINHSLEISGRCDACS